MLIKSPMKEKKVEPNTRRRSSKSAKKRQSSGGAPRAVASHGKRVDDSDQNKVFSLPEFQPWKVVVGALVLGACGLAYLNHVFATQDLLREVQQLEAEYNQVQRLNDDYRLTYDRMIGPADIYSKAQDLGFINGGPAEKVIRVEK